MRVIFVDIDGVLNYPKIWGKTGPAAMDPRLVHMLAKVVEETEAKCVLSSTWRLGDGYEETLKCLEFLGWENVREVFIGKTPVSGTSVRGIEIGEWLHENPEATSFVILDDDNDMGNFMNHLVRTNPKTGLTEKDIEKIKLFFLEDMSLSS
jgi:hypothetical protein